MITFFINRLKSKKTTLYFLIPAVIIQVFNPSADLVMPTKTSTKEAKVEMKIHSVTVETKIDNSAFYSSINFGLLL